VVPLRVGPDLPKRRYLLGYFVLEAAAYAE
jgi:hypothetical protein